MCTPRVRDRYLPREAGGRGDHGRHARNQTYATTVWLFHAYNKNRPRHIVFRPEYVTPAILTGEVGKGEHTMKTAHLFVPPPPAITTTPNGHEIEHPGHIRTSPPATTGPLEIANQECDRSARPGGWATLLGFLLLIKRAKGLLRDCWPAHTIYLSNTLETLEDLAVILLCRPGVPFALPS
ncbi:hypothetical protein SAMD00023353_0202760 [Rosellinia necatrix]|uniref:Uncharacterized protein n=1 Tax=Rosellinia necatrix TaxID=77044 RepID=A0A1S8A529_ROSNE|nr:hypothetical protein SAMD00023353_0202760 [Rosellinia necatrix]